MSSEDFTAGCPECGGLWHKVENRSTTVVLHVSGKQPIERPGIQEPSVIACKRGHRFEVLETKISRGVAAEVKVGRQLTTLR